MDSLILKSYTEPNHDKGEKEKQQKRREIRHLVWRKTHKQGEENYTGRLKEKPERGKHKHEGSKEEVEARK